MTTPEHHPAAAAWPMLPESELRSMAEDIAENGLRNAIVLDTEGRILDGRNRLAACEIAWVEPEFTTYEGDDPGAYVRSVNGNRRNQSLPERAASMALSLALDGKRKDGRWEYGAVGGTAPETHDRGNWGEYMRRSGLVLDYLGEARLQRVANGLEALDAAATQAKKERDLIARREGLPDDLRALVEAGELTLGDAERRESLSEKYAARVQSGDLSLDDAEVLDARDKREHREAIERIASSIEAFVSTWKIAAHMRDSPHRDEALAALGEFDRETFLEIEKETWPKTN